MPVLPTLEPPTILAAADAAMLMSVVKPVLLVATLVPFGWAVSSKLEPDARYYNLNVPLWNGIFLAAAVLGFGAMVAIPIFWVGWPVAILLMAAALFAYWKHRDARVPEAKRFRPFSGQREAAAARRARRTLAKAQVSFVGPRGEVRGIPGKEDPLLPVHLSCEEILVPALERRASRIDIAPAKGGFAATCLIDGVRSVLATPSPEEAAAVIDYLKTQAGLDVADRRRRQNAEFTLQGPTGKVTLSLLTMGSSSGPTLRLDFNKKDRLSVPYETLGLIDPQRAILDGLADPQDRHGLVIVAVPPGQGLSTTCYSLLGRHDAFTSNIKSIEKQAELRLEGVDHLQWDASNPAVPYATQVQSILRRDPDIVFVEDLLEPNTAAVVAAAGRDGPLIYGGMRQATIAAAITEWCRGVGDLRTAAKPLRAVMTQRLVRTLCPNCKQPAQTPPEQLRKLGIPEKAAANIHQAAGKVQVRNRIEDCPVCQGSGYLGQSAVFEIMPIGEEVREKLIAGDLAGAVAEAKRLKMVPIQQAALAKVVTGQTSLEEFVRVFAARPAASTPRPAAAKGPSE